ncbi:MAG: hypothetical protein SGI97_00415 [candidate division Zixibacteria bacterium]|nr:hypothetical protein [candidate division Zixibacteria bacterium]
MNILFYIGIFLFAVGAWQAFMRGTHSEVISGISLILGTVFVFIGNWHAGLFFIFLFASRFLLMQIFRFSTYHEYFYKISLVLIGYAILVAFLLLKFGFENYFWWYLILSGLFLLINHKKQHQAKNFLDLLSGDDKEKRAEAESSFNKTIKYHLLSAVVFIISFAIAFSYFSGGIKTDQFFFKIPAVSVRSSNIEHFSKSIDFANKATKISNSGGAYQQMGAEEIKGMVENYKQALSETKQVHIQKLNSDYQGFGDHYKNELIVGMEMFIDGSEKSDAQKFLQGQVLLSQWGDWYERNFDAIRNL